MFLLFMLGILVTYRSWLFFVSFSVEIYVRMSTDLLPTPAKSHYVFNLRDLSKCIQGLLLCTVPHPQQHVTLKIINLSL